MTALFGIFVRRWLLVFLCACPAVFGASEFDRAIEAYEKGSYFEAATSFERLLTNGPPTIGALYNLGNARFRNGEPGRAIAAWRQVERASPRRLDVKANLSFARRKMGLPEPPAWAGWIGMLSVTEWAVAAAVVAWIWTALLFVCRTRVALAMRLRGLVAATGLLTIVLLAGYSAALAVRSSEMNAVVIARGAGARYGPVEESQVSQPLADGAEVRVEEEHQGWVRVVDSAGRGGWLPVDQVARILN